MHPPLPSLYDDDYQASKRRLARLVAYVVAGGILFTALVASLLLLRYIWRVQPDALASSSSSSSAAAAAAAPSLSSAKPQRQAKHEVVSGGWFNPLLHMEAQQPASVDSPLSLSRRGFPGRNSAESVPRSREDDSPQQI